ncbi:hypothetical protein [Candidatus Rhodobacter oscarellae]|uniref:hypothetical protein n=1 Tax=Candidatus Rhodobacter oscarellae TaxID=1675527 RepID=UPI00128EDCE0|nr:hypothetical protein [Candidatus Rhodobacter lobularis]
MDPAIPPGGNMYIGAPRPDLLHQRHRIAAPVGNDMHCSAEAVDQGRSSGFIRSLSRAQREAYIAFYLAKGFEHVGETHFRIDDLGYLNNVYRFSLL